MDGVDYPVLREEPHLVSPFLGVAVGVLSVIVVYEVGVSDVSVEGRVQRSVGLEGGEL